MKKCEAQLRTYYTLLERDKEKLKKEEKKGRKKKR
ncbi:hypothetical protein FHX95_002910 [Clostridium saccharobutylicum]|nr:hypothetical protein [Clostridium saccharobutylicum]NYC27684.1 hypothetical protein [Clostridium saccharobutylicum]